MAAPSAPTSPRFSPGERPRAAIAADGSLAAIIESQRVVVLELPGGEPFAEVGVDPAASTNEVAWVGIPPRLFVLSRYPEHTRVHLVDPHGPRALADLRIEAPMRLAATCGAHALLVSPQSAQIVTASDSHLVSVPYPSRAVPAHAGVAGANFLVAHADSVEEWDPQARMPKRRLKLPRTATITTLGGSDRVVWMTTQQEPARLDVLALVDRGQPKAHDLPEPIAFATGHPRSDLVVCIGESGKLYVVDLDGRSKLKTLTVEDIDKVQAAGLVVGRIVGVLAAAAEHPVAIVTLEGHAPEPEVAIPRTITPTTSRPTPSTPVAAPATPTPVSTPVPSSGATGSVPAVDAPVERKKPPPPPPGRSGNTMPPPVGGATRSTGATVPPPMPGSTHATGASVLPSIGPPSSGSSSSGPPSSGQPSSGTSSSGTSSSGSALSLPAVAPGASSLARPATRAFARAPTPHPRATSEGVDVDLEGVFDDLSAEGQAYGERAEASEQFDSPLAVEARPVADHPEPTDGSERKVEPTRGAKARAESKTTAESKAGPKSDARNDATRESTSETRAGGKNDANATLDAKRDSTSNATRASTDAKRDSSTIAKRIADANGPAIDSKRSIPSVENIEPSSVDDDDDDDEDLAPPVLLHEESSSRHRGDERTRGERARDDERAPDDGRGRDEAHARDEARGRDDERARDEARGRDDARARDEARGRDDARARDEARRDSGAIRAPVRESSLSLRDTAPRKSRPVTLRQGPALPTAKPAWRDEIVYWTYEVFDGVVERGAPIASPLDDLARRFDVPESILPALVVLYGAHLAGERGVAPVHVARVLGSWDEALGRGLLAARGLATFADSRVRIAGPIQRFLDEVGVTTGALVGVPGTIALPGPHAVIAKAETPLKMVAVRWLAEVGGGILAAHDDADLAELFVEARARGAAPMFRIGADELLELGTDPAILVVTDEEVAESLGVPRLG